jgi:hypothetical protein
LQDIDWDVIHIEKR